MEPYILKKLNCTALDYYVESCIHFSEDTRSRAVLDPAKHYLSKRPGLWAESLDSLYGLDVSWAFHLDHREIYDRVLKEFFLAVTHKLKRTAEMVEDSKVKNNLYDTIQILR